MSTEQRQPEALRLADAVETLCVENTSQRAQIAFIAAAKLRRLHALNAELVAVLQSVTEALAARLGTNAEEWPLVQSARAVTAKAQP